jgi:hypothetical protein
MVDRLTCCVEKIRYKQRSSLAQQVDYRMYAIKAGAIKAKEEDE